MYCIRIHSEKMLARIFFLLKHQGSVPICCFAYIPRLGTLIAWRKLRRAIMPYCRANIDLVYVSFDDSFFFVCLDAFYGFRKRFLSKASAFHAVKKRSNDLCFQIGSLERVCVLLIAF